MTTAHRRHRCSVDVDRLRGLVAAVAADPDRWHQGSYFSTAANTGCLATLTVLLFEPATDPVELLRRAPGGFLLRQRARLLLGLTAVQANGLFFWSQHVHRHPDVGQLRAYLTAALGVDFGD